MVAKKVFSYKNIDIMSVRLGLEAMMKRRCTSCTVLSTIVSVASGPEPKERLCRKCDNKFLRQGKTKQFRGDKQVYYNTNNESGIDLSTSWIKTAKQDDLILRLFQANPSQSFTPEEVRHLCEVCGKNWPITSIRRAINTLTNDDKLTKTNELRKGRYGKQTHTWKLYNQAEEENNTSQIRTDTNDIHSPGQGSI